MRTVAQEMAPQIALRNCSGEAAGKGQYICDFGHAHIFADILHILLPVTRSRHHHEGFYCFSRHEEIEELDS